MIYIIITIILVALFVSYAFYDVFHYGAKPTYNGNDSSKHLFSIIDGVVEKHKKEEERKHLQYDLRKNTKHY